MDFASEHSIDFLIKINLLFCLKGNIKLYNTLCYKLVQEKNNTNMFPSSLRTLIFSSSSLQACIVELS